MKTTEIKIGNTLLFENDIVEVVEINKEAFYVEHPKYGRLKSTVIDLQPIILTSEHLKEHEFNSTKHNYMFEKPITDYGYVLQYLDRRGSWAMGIKYYDPLNDNYIDEVFQFNGVGLRYLHQFENLIELL